MWLRAGLAVVSPTPLRGVLVQAAKRDFVTSPRTTDRSSVESGDVDAVADHVAALIERGYSGPSTQLQSALMAFDRAEPVMFFSLQAGISSLDEG